MGLLDRPRMRAKTSYKSEQLKEEQRSWALYHMLCPSTQEAEAGLPQVFEVSLNHIVNTGPVWTTQQNLVSNKQNK